LISYYAAIVSHVGGGPQNMAKKQSGNKASSIAGKVLAGKKASPKEQKILAGSVLGQDEKRGKRKSGR
jgi:hypothetical protein